MSNSIELPQGYRLSSFEGKVFVMIETRRGADHWEHIQTPEGFNKQFRGANAEKNAAKFCWNHAEDYREQSKA